MHYGYKSHPYRGLEIHENERGEKFDTPYFSIIYYSKKDKKEYHAHANTLSSAKRVVDCFHRIRKGLPVRGNITARNKAYGLFGKPIYMR